MKKIFLSLSAALLLLAACNDTGSGDKPKTDSPAAAKTEVKSETATPPMDSAAISKAWEAFMTPGANHKWLEKMNGTWEGEVSTWMAPGAPAEKAKATNVQRSILGGRYVVGNYTSTMMGMPFEGVSTMGYDNGKKTFVADWVDNGGTGIIHMSGPYDEATKTLTLKGTQTDPLTGKDTDIREELKFTDDNTYVQSMYGAGPDGKEMKFLEGTFKKKK